MSAAGRIREAIEQTYFVELDRQRRQEALERILALEAPVSDWAQMEEEIKRGVLHERNGAAVMRNNGLTHIISTDKHFDRLPGITRLEPRDTLT